MIIKIKKEAMGPWSEAKFAPEEQFLDAVKKVEGITDVETQAYTLEEL